LLPLIGAVTASVTGGAAGCRVGEGGSYPSIVTGQYIGTMLSTLFVMGWLMFATYQSVASASGLGDRACHPQGAKMIAARKPLSAGCEHKKSGNQGRRLSWCVKRCRFSIAQL
jgi:hypothetical protein